MQQMYIQDVYHYIYKVLKLRNILEFMWAKIIFCFPMGMKVGLMQQVTAPLIQNCKLGQKIYFLI